MSLIPPSPSIFDRHGIEWIYRDGKYVCTDAERVKQLESDESLPTPPSRFPFSDTKPAAFSFANTRENPVKGPHAPLHVFGGRRSDNSEKIAFSFGDVAKETKD